MPQVFPHAIPSGVAAVHGMLLVSPLEHNGIAAPPPVPPVAPPEPAAAPPAPPAVAPLAPPAPPAEPPPAAVLPPLELPPVEAPPVATPPVPAPGTTEVPPVPPFELLEPPEVALPLPPLLVGVPLSELLQACKPTASANASIDPDAIINRFMKELLMPGFDVSGQNAGVPFDRTEMQRVARIDHKFRVRRHIAANSGCRAHSITSL